MNLEPLRAALRAEVGRGGASGASTEVDAECARLLADAEQRAHALVRQGRLDGEAARRRRRVRRRATATRRAREIRLRAQRGRSTSCSAGRARPFCGLRDDSRYPALLDRLAAAARDQLGPDAELEVDPPASAA